MKLPIAVLAGAGFTAAQNFVATPNPKDKTVVDSQNYPGASISYKQTQLCETTPGVKAYSGYVTLPNHLLADVPTAAPYNASLFFWYFQSRKNPANAPLSIYIGGGPGSSGMDDSSGFPCTVNADSNSTTLNPWSWNNEVNMLYIDQPVTTGFSYTTLVNTVLDYLNPEAFTFVEDITTFKQTNLTTVPATVSAPTPAFAANTTSQAARTMWHFAQVWFQEFPEHKTTAEEVSIWTVSYGGYFAPAIFAEFERRNELIANSTTDDPKAKPIKLGTVGIQNGCIDALANIAAYPEFAYNNTYGIQAISKEIYEEAKKNITMPGGCADLITACRTAGSIGDPLETGGNQTVNEICGLATQFCFGLVQGAYTTYSNRNAFDIAYTMPATTPTDYLNAFYNQAWVQSALGVPVNFTLSSNLIINLFFTVTGDPMRRSLSDLEYLLQRGKRVALVYGDRDYRCNWPAAENVSLVMSHPGAPAFRSAGYTSIVTNSSYDGGLVRQHGNLSFSRVFQAGHHVAAYQPETVYRIFNRAMFGKDVATGKTDVDSGYSTKGPLSAFGTKNEVPGESPAPVCLVSLALLTCMPNQLEALQAGTAVVEGDMVVKPGPDLGGSGTKDGTPPPGVTPKSENGAGMEAKALSTGVMTAWVVVTVLALVFF
ncbi:Alpha/Beta hydrolase protein [Cercophora newfieldiana]|uniref:Alpha/Beta hydrolase protein n=1 Tax=Cercophora newfieldiana TaxID=92897 RepID=A0AA39YFA1_9PEZI|nr:Alpha/Beta hydrolase protein [Cercophora newfieldiana]